MIDVITNVLGDNSNTPNWVDTFGANLKKIIPQHHTSVLSIFSGGGGLDIGFHDCGCNIAGMVEIDEMCCQTLRMNFDPDKIHHTDIREYQPPSGKIDIIIGGPPCQTFSAAGRRAAGVIGSKDDRGTLFEEYRRILNSVKPSVFVFENVAGILSAEKGKVWECIKSAFSEVGYSLHHFLVDAADYGVAQHRERIFIVGINLNLGIEDFYLPAPTHGPLACQKRNFYSAANAIKNVEISNEEISRLTIDSGEYANLLPDIPPGMNYSFYTERFEHPKPLFAWRSKFADFLYKADPNLPVRTIKASGGQYTGPLHWDNRHFSIAELKRLQSFPDHYIINGPKSDAVKQIGNSVPPQVARMIALAILSRIIRTDIPIQLGIYPKDENTAKSIRAKRRTETQRKYELNAKQIIQSIKHQITYPTNQQYSANIDMAKFQLVPGNGPVTVNVLISDREWIVDTNYDGEYTEEQFSISIRPSWGEWIIPAESVTLVGRQLCDELFLSVWKAWEKILRDSGLKSDIVQINGYYQYKPMISCEMKLPTSYLCDGTKRPNDRWRIVAAVVAGIGVGGSPVHPQTLSTLWNVPTQDVIKYAETLRKMGYEIRNRNTNKTITGDDIMIPYAFPTLNHKSVQRSKSIRQ